MSADVGSIEALITKLESYKTLLFEFLRIGYFREYRARFSRSIDAEHLQDRIVLFEEHIHHLSKFKFQNSEYLFSSRSKLFLNLSYCTLFRMLKLYATLVMKQSSLLSFMGSGSAIKVRCYFRNLNNLQIFISCKLYNLNPNVGVTKKLYLYK